MFLKKNWAPWETLVICEAEVRLISLTQNFQLSNVLSQKPKTLQKQKKYSFRMFSSSFLYQNLMKTQITGSWKEFQKVLHLDHCPTTPVKSD